MAAKRFTIVNGPSKWDLMLALFDSTRSHPRTVDFAMIGAGSFTNSVRIHQIGQEDGSGESWSFAGIAVFSGSDHSVSVKGWFRTSDRHGWLEFID